MIFASNASNQVRIIEDRVQVQGRNLTCAHPGCFIWTPHVHAQSTVHVETKTAEGTR